MNKEQILELLRKGVAADKIAEDFANVLNDALNEINAKDKMLKEVTDKLNEYISTYYSPALTLKPEDVDNFVNVNDSLGKFLKVNGLL